SAKVSVFPTRLRNFVAKPQLRHNAIGERDISHRATRSGAVLVVRGDLREQTSRFGACYPAQIIEAVRARIQIEAAFLGIAEPLLANERRARVQPPQADHAHLANITSTNAVHEPAGAAAISPRLDDRECHTRGSASLDHVAALGH